jgi:hypothetical protein
LDDDGVVLYELVCPYDYRETPTGAHTSSTAGVMRDAGIAAVLSG